MDIWKSVKLDRFKTAIKQQQELLDEKLLALKHRIKKEEQKNEATGNQSHQSSKSFRA